MHPFPEFDRGAKASQHPYRRASLRFILIRFALNGTLKKGYAHARLTNGKTDKRVFIS